MLNLHNPLLNTIFLYTIFVILVQLIPNPPNIFIDKNGKPQNNIQLIIIIMPAVIYLGLLYINNM
tara:strand:- start:95 stop:289 length:195 start_codon:yes stop_codon:yes gene_type:complete